MPILVVGASGATGRLLVSQLLESGATVKIIVRTIENIPASISNHKNIVIIQSSILDISISKLNEYVAGCNAVVSCLGHNLNFKGLFGSPRDLVTLATERLCNSIIENRSKNSTKFILMNTTGNSNRDIPEVAPLSQRVVIFLLRHLLPPHADNENAADILRASIGKNNPFVEWVVVRPDTLVNEDIVTEYECHPSPTRNAIFNSGQTSRINVANFMLKLVLSEELWNHWQGQMPVLYNAHQPKKT